jgi:hypothetical protein
MAGRTDGSVSISLRNFVGEGIITFLSTFNTYRITANMKVETDIRSVCSSHTQVYGTI